jgi:hypothetical protein
LASTVNVTVPFPAPELDAWIHVSLALAVQPHQLPVVTVKLPLAPEALSVPDDNGAIEYEQSAAACETANVWPPTAIEPLRAGPLFASTVNVTVPLPLPELEA